MSRKALDFYDRFNWVSFKTLEFTNNYRWNLRNGITKFLIEVYGFVNDAAILFESADTAFHISQ